MNTLETKLDDAKCDIDSKVKLSSNVYRYSIDSNSKTLTYAINTPDDHAHEVPEVAALLSSVSAVFMAGYSPNFNGLLPGLETIYTTFPCKEDLYDEWTGRYSKSRKIEWLRVYDSDWSGCDVFDKIPSWSDDSEYSESQYSDSRHSDSE